MKYGDRTIMETTVSKGAALYGTRASYYSED